MKIVIATHYELSSSGEIRNMKTGRLLKPWIRSGYYNIRCGSKGKKQQVHRMVAIAFIENPDPQRLTQVNHKDGNKLNNDFTNLEWVSPAENIQHMHSIGLWNRKDTYKASKGKDHYMSDLNENDVIEMREMYKTGKYSYRQLGDKYGIHLATVGYIIQRKTWKHI
jgi:hypothetical protein